MPLNCGILVNSASASGLFQSGAGYIQASVIKVVGGYTVACADPSSLAGVNAFPDPLAGCQRRITELATTRPTSRSTAARPGR